jgi:uncharacterized membrane protein YccF (DUF307 family)
MHPTITTVLLCLIIVPASVSITVLPAIFVAAIPIGQEIYKADRWFILQKSRFRRCGSDVVACMDDEGPLW